ncbi:ubiquitin carboxyl-terminal hydrolase 10-like [Haliotis rufescens]|uniref:ubiquitin carboxyl-terminal hydrolase 10-like n=1 Tax=Haliotis rufescens TaxID=6454 RepID=UPI001EB08580|nr:ubiquitin carboxyl-terminal hydrolase 10-like [Haliotis rufescens]
MELSDQSVSFGDFSGLDDATFERVYKILHGADGAKRVEFPWNGPDPNYPEDADIQSGFIPVDAVPTIPGTPIFVPQYPGMFPVPTVPAVVAPYPVAPIVNGIALGPPYHTQPVPVPMETIYTQNEGAHIVTSPPGTVLCNGPVVSSQVYELVQVSPPNVPQAKREAASSAPAEFDFVYSDPGSEVPVSTSTELIQHIQTEHGPVPEQTLSPQSSKNSGPPDRTSSIVNTLGQQVENVSVSSSVAKDNNANASPDASVPNDPNLPVKQDSIPVPQPTSPPKPKSWAGLFKGSSAIVTYVDDTKREPSPQPTQAPETKVEETTKQPVPVGEDSAAAQLGGMLKTLKINHISVALQPRGLINRGNWCYINATLQALVACPPFFQLMRKLCEFAPLIRGPSSTPILDSLIAFSKKFSPWTRPQARGGKKAPELIPGSPFEPNNVYQMLQVIEANPSFKLGKQEDAEEFLNCILDGLHEEMSATINLASGGEREPEDVQENGYVDDEDGSEDEEDSWQQVGPKKKSIRTRRAAFAKTPIADIFAGHIRSAVYKAASKESATLEPFFTLKLDIQDEKIWTVRDALEGLVTKEAVQGYQCSKTNQEVEVVKKISLEELPPILILHLKCFVFDKTGGSQKLLKKIDFDVDLNITKDLLSSTAKAKIQHTHRSYKLFAVVFHHGKNSTGGHYTTDVFHPGISSWVHIDDARIQAVQVGSVLKYTAPRMPYLLYYRRTDLS